MKQSINSAIDTLSWAGYVISRCRKVMEIRNLALVDPAASVKLANDAWLPAEVTKFGNILDKEANISIAREDYLKALNSTVVKQVDEIKRWEASVVETYDKLINVNTTLANNIVKHDRWVEVVAELSKRTSSLPYLEQLTKQVGPRVARYIASIKSPASVTSLLYGINGELMGMDMSVFSAPAYDKLNTYITEGAAPSKTSVDTAITKVNDSVSAVESYTGFTNTQATPNTDISSVDILIGIVREIRSITSDVGGSISTHKLAADGTSKLMAVKAVLAEDPTALPDDLSAALDDYQEYAYKLVVCLGDVVTREVPLYIALATVLEAMGVVDIAVFGHAD